MRLVMTVQEISVTNVCPQLNSIPIRSWQAECRLERDRPSRTIDSRLLSHHQSTGARPLAGLVCDLSWHVNMAGRKATFNIKIDVWMRVDAPGHDCSKDQCH